MPQFTITLKRKTVEVTEGTVTVKASSRSVAKQMVRDSLNYSHAQIQAVDISWDEPEVVGIDFAVIDVERCSNG